MKVGFDIDMTFRLDRIYSTTCIYSKGCVLFQNCSDPSKVRRGGHYNMKVEFDTKAYLPSTSPFIRVSAYGFTQLAL